MSAAPLYALKACALLLPSPFAWIDPKGEAMRRAELRDWLQSAGVEVSAVNQERLEACADEAHDALVQPLKLPEARDVPPLRHPLSAEALQRRVRAQDVATLHAGLLSNLRRLTGAVDGPWYRRLWRTLMRDPSYRDLPADPRLPDHTVSAHRSLTAALAGATLGGDRPALLALHVGPVQSFIAAARRTHDLSIGSYTIGFLAFAAARMLAEELGPDVLIHPDVSNRALADQLLFQAPPAEEDRAKLLRAALVNKILAVLPDRQADELARRAAEAVAGTWRDMAKATKKHLGLGSGEDRGFNEQIEKHLDIDLVVQPWPAANAEIKKLLDDAKLPCEPWLERAEPHPGAACGALTDLAERTMAAHRRTITSTGWEGDHRPKCTSCGLREQMGQIVDSWRQQVASRNFFGTLSERIQRHGDVRGSLQIAPGEGLCAVCLTKRFAPEVYYGAAVGELGLAWADRDGDRPLLRFPSTATIASAPLRFYLQKISGPNRNAIDQWLDRLEALHTRNHLDFTPPRNLLAGLGPIGADSRLLAHDGTWLYESTYEPDVVWRNHFTVEPEQDENRVRYSNIKNLVIPARKAFAGARRAVGGKSASPYYAVIVLDGDRMGDWKSGCHDRSPTIGEMISTDPNTVIMTDELANRRPVHPALYGELSRRVADLGLDLHKIIDRHLGRLVYHGGDDLLALVPLATVLPCLEEIRCSIQSAEHLGNRVTISAGVAVSHWRAPLAGALEAARKAEASAKRAGRDRFAIHADKRSGETLEIVLPWTVKNKEGQVLFAVIPTLGQMLDRDGRDELALADAKAAYQLREELPVLADPQLRDALLQRIGTLVFAGRTGTSEPEALLRALLAYEAGGDFPKRAAQVVDLLLFLRFLLREEHGIATKKLRASLPAKEDMP